VKAELTIESIAPDPAAPTMLAIAPISTIGYMTPYEVHELHILVLVVTAAVAIL
jgi:hypothetical protein